MTSLNYPPPFSHRIGDFILAEISAISTSSAIVLLGYIAYSAVTIRQGARRRWRLTSPVHLFLLNQLVCDLIQALCGLMNMKWVVNGNIHQGAFCIAQGLIKQVASVGTALAAGSVAIHTFSTLIFRLRPDTNLFRAALIVGGIWVTIVLNMAINVGIHGVSRFYGPTGPWCWITKEFGLQRTVANYMWIWISAFSSLLAYMAVFLVLGGFIAVEGWRVRRAPRQGSPTIPRSHVLAYKMLAYPIIYIITVIPLAAARYNDFDKGDNATPFFVLVLADGFYLSSDFLNVVLYRCTRPYLLPHCMDNLDNQSFVLCCELTDSQTHLPSSDAIGNNHHASGNMEHKSADSAYVAHQDETPGDHKISGDELTEGDAANIDDDVWC